MKTCFYHFPNISCLKCTVNSNFHLIRSKTLLTNDFELTVPNLYLYRKIWCDVVWVGLGSGPKNSQNFGIYNLHSVADPGFSQGGASTIRGGGWGEGGRQHMILPKFPENCMKMKEFRPPGACNTRAPLRSIMTQHPLVQLAR